MRIVAIANQKGGCGKTTVGINLAACLAREGRRTLLVDMDPQGHCALGLAVPEDQIEMSIHDVLVSGWPAGDQESADQGTIDLSRCTWQISANFDLAPSSTQLASFELQHGRSPGSEQRLAEILAAAGEQYEFVLIDCPPHIGLLTRNALNAASEVLIPVDTGYFSLQGLSKQLATVECIRNERVQPLQVRVLANLYDVRTKLGREILNELKRKFGPMMCSTFINFNTKLREGASFGQPITEYDPGSMGFRDFVRLARELIAGGGPDVVPQTLMQQAENLAARAEKLLATSRPLFGKNGFFEDGDPIESPNHEPQNHEAVQEKIDRIYGVRATEEGVVFVAHAPEAENVMLAGDFNNWSPQSTPMVHGEGDGRFKALLPLSPGKYCYRYVIDGRWCHDPHNERVETNPFGDLNSVVEVS